MHAITGASILQPVPAMASSPAWLQTFLDRLAADDLSAATRRGYRYDLLHFITRYTGLYDVAPELTRLTEHDLITCRAGSRQLPSTAGWRRCDGCCAGPKPTALWRAMLLSTSSRCVSFVIRGRLVSRRHRCMACCALLARVLTGLLGAITPWSSSCFKLVGEGAALRRSDVVLRERAGTIRVRNGKGLKERQVPLNATARRALRQLLEPEPAIQPEAAVFRSGHSTVMPVRSIQNVIAALTRRAGLTGSDITAHSLRHTFALAWLRQHPGQLVELSQLLGHESLDTTAVYTRASAADLARGVEQTLFNLDG